MAFVVKDRVKVTTVTTGTGTLTLGSAATGFQTFSVIGDGNTTSYAIVDSASGTWEIGIGTYTASGTTLSRTTVLESSNSGSLVNFGAGDKDVFVTYPAEKAVFLGVNQNITSSGMWENAITINEPYTIGTGNNAISAGPITIASGITVTVPSGSAWTIVGV